ncbi:hypothetical protein GQ457_08G000840 [Hibiscus cannabinus]
MSISIRGDTSASASGSNDGWLGLTQEPCNGLTVRFEPKFSSELENPSGTNRWQADAPVSAINLCMAVFGCRPETGIINFFFDSDWVLFSCQTLISCILIYFVSMKPSLC